MSFLPVTLAISVMGREDVLLANSVVLNGGEREGERAGGREKGEKNKSNGGRERWRDGRRERRRKAGERE